MTVKSGGSMSAAVLVMGCGPRSPHGRDQMQRLYAQARDRGVELIGAEKPANLACADTSFFSSVIACDVEDPAAAVEALRTLDATLVGGLAFRDLCVEPLAAVGEALGFPCVSTLTARTTRNKDLCREQLRRAALPQPASRLVNGREEALEFLEKTAPGPWIVKPRDGMGSADVDLVRSPDELDAALAGRPAGVPFLVEEFVSGPEYSADGVAVGGRPVIVALAQKSLGPRFVETGHRIPADMSATQSEDVHEQVETALLAVGLTHGLFHVEFWLTGSGVVLGEIHARPGGAFIPTMAEYVRPGLELYGMYVDDALGVEPSRVPALSRSAGMRHILVGPPGRLVSVSGWEDAVSAQEVIAARLSVKPGDEIGPVCWSADRHGFVVVEGASGADVDARLDRIQDRIVFEVTR
ncbi:ATP-grasp domain-containing protein [Streptomyces cinnamoneus]|uniref:ATP-grasp domain-containing protein n=1 Tax=Streptomyces cinnamoneus TaxID=53446 RepID=UPI00343F7576